MEVNNKTAPVTGQQDQNTISLDLMNRMKLHGMAEARMKRTATGKTALALAATPAPLQNSLFRMPMYRNAATTPIRSGSPLPTQTDTASALQQNKWTSPLCRIHRTSWNRHTTYRNCLVLTGMWFGFPPEKWALAVMTAGEQPFTQNLPVSQKPDFPLRSA